jgi:Ca2+/Na+ antiporter
MEEWERRKRFRRLEESRKRRLEGWWTLLFGSALLVWGLVVGISGRFSVRRRRGRGIVHFTPEQVNYLLVALIFGAILLIAIGLWYLKTSRSKPEDTT